MKRILILALALLVGLATPASATNLKWQLDGTPNNAVNLSPATGAVLAFNIQQALKQCGWVVVQWTDGTTLTTSSAGWSSGASGAGGAANTSAWLRMTDPTATKEFIIQRSTTNLLWRMKWSHSSKFTGGSPSATVTPTAADQQFVAGTDVPAFIGWLGSDASYKAHIVCDADAPYSWIVITMPSGGGAARSLWYLGMVSGSYPSADVAPYVVAMRNGDTTVAALQGTTINTNELGEGYYKKGLSGEAWLGWPAQQISDNSSTAAPNGYGTNPYTGDDQIFPIPVGRRSALGSGGWKGWLPVQMVGWIGVSRSDGDYFDTVGGSRYMITGDIGFRFPASVIPSL